MNTHMCGVCMRADLATTSQNLKIHQVVLFVHCFFAILYLFVTVLTLDSCFCSVFLKS